MKYITASEISEKSGVDHKTCLKVLNALESKGYLKMKYVSICPECHAICEEYESLNDIPIEFSCEKCGKNKIDIFSNTYITFSKW